MTISENYNERSAESEEMPKESGGYVHPSNKERPLVQKLRRERKNEERTRTAANRFQINSPGGWEKLFFEVYVKTTIFILYLSVLLILKLHYKFTVIAENYERMYFCKWERPKRLSC